MTPVKRPFSQACEENKDAIYQIIEPLFSSIRSVMEIGSGTGQHAIYFSKLMPHLIWQTSDRPENHPGILAWIESESKGKVLPPLNLDVTKNWPNQTYDAVFSANTAHIMSGSETEAMIRGLPQVLNPGGLFVLYGPFNYGGRYTSESNARFDEWLSAHHPSGSIKDFDDLNAWAKSIGLILMQDHAMPANNRTLVWRLSSD